MKELRYKGVEDVLKDVDIPSMTVSGYFSKFNNIDRDGDIIVQGAFKKTIKERGPKSAKPEIAYLLQHDSWKPLGKITELKEDSIGLYFEAKISDTSYGLDTLKLYRDGVYNQHSIGFNIMKSSDFVEGGNNYQEIQEVKLWEGSVVTWGANADTPFTGFKGYSQDEKESRIKLIIKAIKGGDFTDETYSLLEYELLKLTALDVSKSVEPLKEDEPNLIEEFRKLLV